MTELRFVPATLDDAGYAADLFTENQPGDPADPLLLRHFWSNPQPGAVAERYVVTAVDGSRIGFVAQFHQDWAKLPTRYGQVNASLALAAKTAARLDAAFAFVEARSRESGTAVFTANTSESDRLKQEVLLARGYAVERRYTLWECDLVSNAAMLRRMVADARRAMRDQGIRLVTFERPDPPPQ